MLSPDIKIAVLSVGRFSDEHLDIFAQKLEETYVAAQQVLIAEGTVCNGFYFISKGSFRQYSISDAGDEITHDLFVTGDWMLDYKSFTAQQPATANTVALEDSSLYFLSVNHLHDLMKHNDAFFQLGKLFQQAIQSHDYRTASLSPEKKYRMLLDAKPAVIQTVPLKYIASYLNMTPETLSRVRRKITN